MRTLAAVLVAAVAAIGAATLDAAAQSTERPRPPGTTPFADAPPPPPITERAPEPDVSERIEGGQKIQEYRIHGKLYMQKVTPAHGKAYILMDQRGDGTFTRLDQPLDAQVRVPQWVLLEF
jgi:uncharacterized protein DUF2782